MADLPDGQPPAEGTWLPSQPWSSALEALNPDCQYADSNTPGTHVRNESRAFYPASTSSSNSGNPSTGSGGGSDLSTNSTSNRGSNTSSGSGSGPSSSSRGVKKVEYSADQLDTLALSFTVVKALFLGGALPQAAKLCQLLAPAVAASNIPLHLTLIRNEAAYYGCLQQLLELAPRYPLGDAPELQPLYLCGDSHCLSGAG